MVRPAGPELCNVGDGGLGGEATSSLGLGQRQPLALDPMPETPPSEVTGPLVPVYLSLIVVRAVEGLDAPPKPGAREFLKLFSKGYRMLLPDGHGNISGGNDGAALVSTCAAIVSDGGADHGTQA